MLFTKFESLLSKVIDLPLPGIEAQKKMAPVFRIEELKNKPENKNLVKKSAVLCLFYPNENGLTHFTLIERGIYKGVHSGQISFPGGRKEEEDLSFWGTALREANEEIGVPKEVVTEVKTLSTFYIPPSNFIVHPFMAISRSKPDFKPEEKEVQRIIEVPLSELLLPKNETHGLVTTSYVGQVDVPLYLLQGVQVWGATATILSEIKDVISSVLKE
jgi:8-oxo-dGTP pyrophosphatase MutT (NUDIX family)